MLQSRFVTPSNHKHKSKLFITDDQSYLGTHFTSIAATSLLIFTQYFKYWIFKSYQMGFFFSSYQLVYIGWYILDIGYQEFTSVLHEHKHIGVLITKGRSLYCDVIYLIKYHGYGKITFIDDIYMQAMQLIKNQTEIINLTHIAVSYNTSRAFTIWHYKDDKHLKVNVSPTRPCFELAHKRKRFSWENQE